MYRERKRVSFFSGLMFFLLCVAVFSFIFFGSHYIERYSYTIPSLERRLKEHPDDIKAMIKLASFYLEKAKKKKDIKLFKESIILYRRALALDEKGKNAKHIFYPLGVAYFWKASLMDGYFWKDAESFFLKAINEGEEISSAHSYLGAIRRALKDYDGALRHYRLAYFHDKEKVENIFNLAWAYKDCRLYEKAKELFAKLQNANLPLSLRVELHTALGLIHYEQGLLKEAKEHLNRAILLDQKACEAHYLLARICAKEGKMEEATRILDAILRINPEYEPALSLRGRIKR